MFIENAASIHSRLSKHIWVIIDLHIYVHKQLCFEMIEVCGLIIFVRSLQ